MEKSSSNVSQADTIKTTSDVVIFGNTDTWQLLTKASSKSQGWMKSSKAMEIEGVGCVVQVTTEFTEPCGRKSIAESVTFVPNVRIMANMENKEVAGRYLISIR